MPKLNLSSELLLTHYNPSMAIIAASDVANYARVDISQLFPGRSVKVIAHDARFLTLTECNYVQIEKESLSNFVCH